MFNPLPSPPPLSFRCPYFLARHMINQADLVVFSYQYMLDPKIAKLITAQFNENTIIIFDEAHNIGFPFFSSLFSHSPSSFPLFSFLPSPLLPPFPLLPFPLFPLPSIFLPPFSSLPFLPFLSSLLLFLLPSISSYFS